MKLKTLARAAILAAGSLAGAAQAADYTGNTLSLAGFQALVTAGDTWTVGDLRLSGFSWGAGALIGSTDTANDTVSLVRFGASDSYSFRYSASPSASNAQGIGTLDYLVTALNTRTLVQAWTDMSGSSGTPVGSLSLEMPQGGGALSTVTAVTSTGGAPSPFLALSGDSSTSRTSWNIGGTTYVSSLQNNYQLSSVPAPLPLLGVVAAFGWSRRLRQRVRQASLAA